MAGPRGYSSYRGRGSKAKKVLSVVLVLIILAAVGFMMLQRYIVYDETGRPYMEMPWQKDETPDTQPEAPQDLDVTIQEPEESETVTTAYQIAATPLTQSDWERVQVQMGLETGRPYNAVAVTAKDSTGRIYFNTGVPAAVPFAQTAGDTAATLAAIAQDEGRTAVARLSCFHDSKASNADVEGMGLKNTGGYIFYDGNNTQWLDPGKPAARQYLCQLAKELAEMGFDEILLTDVSYPTEGKLDKIYYGETMKSQNIMTFLEEMRDALEAYDVTLSVELPETVVAEGSDNIAGLMLADIAPRVDRVYAVTTADQIETLAAAVDAVAEKTDFVPELTAPASVWAGSSLVVSGN